MFNDPSGFSLGELKKARRLYMSEQQEFLVGQHPSLKWRFHRTSLRGIPGKVPDTAEDGVLLRCRDVRSVTERHFVHDDQHFYLYRVPGSFRSFRWLLPHYSLYDIEVDKVFASFGYCHNNYYHDVTEYMFQGYLLSKMGITNIPLLWMGSPNPVQKELIDALTCMDISFTCIPSKLSRVIAGEVWALPPSHARIGHWPWNHGGTLFDQFRGYREMLLSKVAWEDCGASLPKKIYSTRNATARRVVANNQEFEEYFSGLGFEVLSFGDYTFSEQVALARNAHELVGMHGANLTNAMFMRSGSRVVELMPHKKDRFDYYRAISYIFDLDYQRIPLIRRESGGYALDNIKPYFS